MRAKIAVDTVFFAPIDSNGFFRVPEKSYTGDAGYDLTVSEDVVVQPRGFAEVKTNIAVALPSGCWCMIIGRSSTFKKRNLIVNPGIIDNGWRGELLALVYNPTDRWIEVKQGERLVQMILFKIEHAFVVATNHEFLPEGERGTNGFGSTGGFAV